MNVGLPFSVAYLGGFVNISERFVYFQITSAWNIHCFLRGVRTGLPLQRFRKKFYEILHLAQIRWSRSSSSILHTEKSKLGRIKVLPFTRRLATVQSNAGKANAMQGHHFQTERGAHASNLAIATLLQHEAEFVPTRAARSLHNTRLGGSF
eukprot:scaffold71430_cov31-Tisochrysis_lutea.AAC.1